MPIELVAGDTRRLDVQLTPISLPFDPWVYDTNGNCYIDISEQLVAVEDYFGLLITIDQLNEVKYLYENNIRNPACPAFDPWVYDTDGSGYIEVSEQLAAVADYFDLLITIDQLNEVKYLYEGHVYRW